MHPILFSFGPFHFRVYGLLLAISFLLGSWLALRRGRARGVHEEVLSGLIGWILISAVVGARVAFVVAHPDQFASVIDALKIWEGGLTEYGGLVGAILVSWLYLRSKRVPFLLAADIIAPSLALGEGITRIGCFMNGCCFGKECANFLAVHFPPNSYVADVFGAGAAVYPSQLFLSAALFVSFAVIVLLEKRIRGLGGAFGLYLVLQGIARYGIDYTRYYEPADSFRATAPFLETHSQLVALILLLFGVVLIIRARRAAVGQAHR